jgi:hypothetical protein
MPPVPSPSPDFLSTKIRTNENGAHTNLGIEIRDDNMCKYASLLHIHL